MAYIVFEVPKEKKIEINKVTSNDLVGRQSIAIREGASLDMDAALSYVLIEGSQEALDIAKGLFSSAGIQPSEKGEDVLKRIKAQESDAADGMGMIFG